MTEETTAPTNSFNSDDQPDIEGVRGTTAPSTFPVLLRKIPQEVPNFTTQGIGEPQPHPPSTSTFTPLDKRVQFVKEVEDVEEGSWKMARILRRFDDWELFQRERLEKLCSRVGSRSAFAKFAAWKSIASQFQRDPPEKRRPSSAVTRSQVEWLQSCSSVQEMMRQIPRWRGASNSLRRDRDIQLISVAMQFVPEKLRPLLECVIRTVEKSSLPDFYVIEDVVDVLALRLDDTEPDRRPACAADLALLGANILQNSRSGYIQISQASIFRILNALPDAQVAPWYQDLCDVDCHLHRFTQLHFASRLANSPSTKKLSAQILCDLGRAGQLDINDPLAASVCTSILTFKKEDPAALDRTSATPADLFGTLHGIGLNPNVITYSAIIRGLCLKKDIKTALEVFEFMKCHGVDPDEFTFSILINGCKAFRKFDVLADIAIQACFANIRDPVVWNDVLHAVYIACLREPRVKRGSRRTPLFAMNSVYTRLFDPEPIRPFITKALSEIGEFSTAQKWFPDKLHRLYSDMPALPVLEVMQPRSDTVAIMLLGLVRYLPMPYDVVLFYLQFRQMLADGHPIAERMVRERGTFVHDIVLRNLIKWRGTLRVALDIIRDMMKDVEGKPDRSVGDSSATSTGHWDAEGEGDASFVHAEGQPPGEEGPFGNGDSEHRREPIRHPAPSVYTWSILLHGFMRHKQPKDAESIIALMREHGVTPNIVTWNTLAAGYAKMQMIPQAVETMRRLEVEGFKADDGTLRAFSYIANKTKAIHLMEVTVEANRLKKMASDLGQQDAGEQLQPAEEAQQDLEEAGQWQQHISEEEVLDQELDARLLQLDPGVVPNELSQKILRAVHEMKNVAPVHLRPDLVEWARIRQEGLDAVPVPADLGNKSTSQQEASEFDW